MSIHRAMASALALGVLAAAAIALPAAAEEEKKEAAAEPKKPAGLLEILKVGKEKEAEKKEPAKEEAKDAAKPEAKEAPKDAPKEEAKKDGEAKEKADGDAKKEAREAVMKALQGKKARVVEAAVAAEKAAAEGAAIGGATPAAPETKEAASEKKEAAPPPKKKEPQPPMFRLRDGTRLAGVPDIQLLHIATPYGRLEVPVGEVVQIRFAALNDPELAGRIAEAIAGLGSEEFDKREEAMAALRKIGGPALDALKKALASEDEEVKSRAEKLVGEIEEELSEAEEESRLGPISGEEDEVVTLKFTALGRVEEEVFPLATRYGTLKLKRGDIVSIVFQEAPTTRSTFQVPGNTFAAANKWHDTKLSVTKGEGLHITASGTITIANYGQSTGPEGTTNIGGNQFEGHLAGSLVGRIGDKGKAFLVGPEYRGTANETGTLRLAVSLQNGDVTGSYQVEVEVEGGS